MSNPVIAAIDVGSNSFHIMIAKINKKNKIKIIYKEKQIMRLCSEFAPSEKKISEKEIDKSIRIFKKYKKTARKYSANIFAKATSAVREAQNGDEYINRIKETTGITVDKIKGKKEAELIYKGMQTALPLSDKRVLCFDIGGGSTEILYGVNGKTIFAESIKVGAVRMMQKFFSNNILTQKKIGKCKTFVKSKIKSKKGIDFEAKHNFVVGASGTIHAAAAIIYYKKYKKLLKKPNGFEFTNDEFSEITNLILTRKTVLERLNIEGLEKERADIIPAGLIILNVIFNLFNIKKMVLSENALRAGIIFEGSQELKNI